MRGRDNAAGETPPRCRLREPSLIQAARSVVSRRAGDAASRRHHQLQNLVRVTVQLREPGVNTVYRFLEKPINGYSVIPPATSFRGKLPRPEASRETSGL